MEIAPHTTMAGFGCVLTSVAYILSRFTDHDINPGEWMNWCKRRGYITSTGLFVWSAVSAYTKGALSVSLWNPTRAKYTGRWVKVAGQDHFCIHLRNPKTGMVDLLFDPLSGGVVHMSKYPDTHRRVYFRV